MQEEEPALLPGTGLPTTHIDDWQGAGALRGDRAVAVMDANSFFSPSSNGAPQRVERDLDFEPVPLVIYSGPVAIDQVLRWKEDLSFFAVEDQLVRVAAAWDNCPGGIWYADTPAPLFVNFDLSVRGPLGRTKTNPSKRDNYEMLAFKAPETGWYDIQITVLESEWLSCMSYWGFEAALAVAWDVKGFDD